MQNDIDIFSMSRLWKRRGFSKNGGVAKDQTWNSQSCYIYLRNDSGESLYPQVKPTYLLTSGVLKILVNECGISNTLNTSFLWLLAPNSQKWGNLSNYPRKTSLEHLRHTDCKNTTKFQTSVFLFGCLKSIYKRSLVEGEESRVSRLMGKSITENC